MTGADDPWAVLGLRRGATPDAVSSAWRALVVRHHPDAGGDPERFRELIAARDRLASRTTGTGDTRGPVLVVTRPNRVARLLRPLRRRIDRRLNPRVH